MAAPITRRNAEGTISAIRKVRVDTTLTQFAMVVSDDDDSRRAIRIGLNTKADGDDCFFVGDRVKYTILMIPECAFSRAVDLEKLGVDRNNA